MHRRPAAHAAEPQPGSPPPIASRQPQGPPGGARALRVQARQRTEWSTKGGAPPERQHLGSQHPPNPPPREDLRAHPEEDRKAGGALWAPIKPRPSPNRRPEAARPPQKPCPRWPVLVRARGQALPTRHPEWPTARARDPRKPTERNSEHGGCADKETQEQ